MTETGWMIFLRNLSIVCGVTGVIFALAFLFGPKVFLRICRVLDKLRPSLEAEKILEAKARLILGIALLVMAVLMLALVFKIRV